MALRAGAGHGFRGLRSIRQVFPMVTRSGGALAPRPCTNNCPPTSFGCPPTSFGRRFYTKDSDTLLRENIKEAVQKGLNEALGTNDCNSILKLSVVKSGVNDAVQESMKRYKVYIDYAKSDLDPVMKAAIEDSVVQGLENFAYQLHKVPPQEGQVKGAYLLQLAFKEALKEGMDDTYRKLTVFFARGIDMLIRDLSLIKDQTKGTDFVQVWFSGLAHQWLSKGFIKFIEESWIVMQYVAGVYLFVLFVCTLVESGIPPWEYPDVLNCYRTHGLTSALVFYKKMKKKKEEAAAEAKSKEGTEGSPQWFGLTLLLDYFKQKKAEPEANKGGSEAAAQTGGPEAASQKKAEAAMEAEKGGPQAPAQK